MQVDHRAARLALRTRLLSLPAVASTTPGTALTATTAGFTRTGGSFVSEGFLRGMEVTPTGFIGAAAGIIESVGALSMTVSGTRTPEASGVDRSLTVGVPARQAWENISFEPEDGRWFIEEQYLPGGAPVLIAGGHTNGEFETEPVYILRIYGVQGKGTDALEVVGKGVMDHFPAGLTLETYAGQKVRVRSDAAPFPGQIVPQGTGHSVYPITIPLWAWTTA